MEILDKDKEHFVSELEKLTGTRLLFYLKFCSEEKFATDICEGRWYADEKCADFLFPFTEEENECDYILDKVEYCE